MTSHSDSPDKLEQDAHEAIALAETHRKMRALKIFAVVLLGAGAFGAMGIYLGGGVNASVPVEKGEEETLALTNDPQCREMIQRVGALKPMFKIVEAQVEADLLAEDPAKVDAVRVQMRDLKQSIAKEGELSQSATLRYEESRKELDAWFEYVQKEFDTLDRTGQKHLTKLAQKARGEVEVKFKKKKRRANQPPERTSTQQRDAAVVAIYDSFDKFRVWHTAGFHPCGAAAKGETPWTAPTPTTKPAATPAAGEPAR